jgi:hypothetical protein
MRIDVRFAAAAPPEWASVYLRLLDEALQRAHPASFQTRANERLVRGGVLRPVSNWNLLGAISAATFSVEPRTSEVEVRVRASVTALVAFAALATLLFTVESARLGAAAWQIAAVGLGLPWLCLFGLYYWLARYRLVRLLRRIANEATRVAEGERG